MRSARSQASSINGQSQVSSTASSNGRRSVTFAATVEPCVHATLVESERDSDGGQIGTGRENRPILVYATSFRESVHGFREQFNCLVRILLTAVVLLSFSLALVIVLWRIEMDKCND